MNKKIICQQCKHYYVTWERAKPHGCRAYGFKSQQLCCVVVKQSSSIDCSLFVGKISNVNNENKSNNFNNSQDTI
jgi:hypothetical protein